MSVFPKLGKINETALSTLKSRNGNKTDVSNLLSWVRVASAANNGFILESIPDRQTFAETYGTSKRSGRVGLTFGGEEIFAENDRGYRPSPTIDSVSIENGNQGLSRKAKFTVKCYTLAQAELIAQYLYQPGFCVLVEYGWNVSDSYENRANLTPGDGACEMAKYNNYLHITDKREKSKGTYDGFLGRITGGGFQSSDDETYTIDVELTTLGEIPAYLQVHRSGVVDNKDGTADSSLRYTVAETKGAENNTDLRLFQQVYNRLPNEKRTTAVKTLTNINEVDVNGLPYIIEYNFVNVDEKLRKILLEEFSSWFGKDVKVGSGEFNVPEGAPLISEDSYIRMELALKILNTYSVDLERDKPQAGECSGDIKTFSYIINTDDTIIGAHKWMFSIDGSKLFIPNEVHPLFGLEAAFSDTENASDVILRPAQLGSTAGGNSPEDIITNLNPWQSQGEFGQKYAFPSPQKLEADNTHKDIIPQTAKEYNWGYLRNLYVNLDFFIEVLQRSNYTAKDILYELLNGISSAAGSQWQFQIVDVPHESREGASTFDRELKVVDLNFIGAADVGSDSVAKFQSRGVDSPFLDSSLSLPIPAAMRNQILGKYNSSVKLTANTDGPDENFQTFFSKELDPVSKILNSFKESEKKTPQESTGGDAPTREEILKSNFEIFMSKATVVPKKQNKIGEVSPDITESLMVVAWEDSKLLKQVAMRFGKFDSKRNKTISQILSIDFTFEILGMSGLKVGDVFQITDLPSQFKDGVFQIMEQNHTLSDGLWKTSVTAKMRNFTV